MAFLQRFFKAIKKAIIRMMEAIKTFWEKHHIAVQKSEKQQVKERIIQASPAIKWDMRRKSQVIDRRPFVSHKKIFGQVRR